MARSAPVWASQRRMVESTPAVAISPAVGAERDALHGPVVAAELEPQDAGRRIPDPGRIGRDGQESAVGAEGERRARPHRRTRDWRSSGSLGPWGRRRSSRPVAASRSSTAAGAADGDDPAVRAVRRPARCREGKSRIRAPAVGIPEGHAIVPARDAGSCRRGCKLKVADRGSRCAGPSPSSSVPEPGASLSPLAARRRPSGLNERRAWPGCLRTPEPCARWRLPDLDRVSRPPCGQRVGVEAEKAKRLPSGLNATALTKVIAGGTSMVRAARSG